MQIRKSLTKLAPVIFGLTLLITDGYSVDAVEWVDPPTVFANQTLVILDKTTDNFETPMPPPPSYFFQSLCKFHTGNGRGGEK